MLKELMENVEKVKKIIYEQNRQNLSKNEDEEKEKSINKQC